MPHTASSPGLLLRVNSGKWTVSNCIKDICRGITERCVCGCHTVQYVSVANVKTPLGALTRHILSLLSRLERNRRNKGIISQVFAHTQSPKLNHTLELLKIEELKNPLYSRWRTFIVLKQKSTVKWHISIGFGWLHITWTLQKWPEESVKKWITFESCVSLSLLTGLLNQHVESYFQEQNAFGYNHRLHLWATSRLNFKCLIGYI